MLAMGHMTRKQMRYIGVMVVVFVFVYALPPYTGAALSDKANSIFNIGMGYALGNWCGSWFEWARQLYRATPLWFKIGFPVIFILVFVGSGFVVDLLLHFSTSHILWAIIVRHIYIVYVIALYWAVLNDDPNDDEDVAKMLTGKIKDLVARVRAIHGAPRPLPLPSPA